MNTSIDENLVYVFVVAGSVIERDGKFLLVQERQPKAYGLWNLPAGKVEKCYTIEETAIKEVKEETGFDVDVVKELGVFHQDGDRSVKHAFEVKVIGGEINFPKDEILDAKWLSYEDILELSSGGKLRADWVLKAIEIYKGKNE